MSDIQEMNPFLQNALETNNPVFLNFTPLPHRISHDPTTSPISEPDLLKKTVSDMQISTERLPKFDPNLGKPLSTESEQYAALLRKHGTYVGRNNDIYRVMTAEQSYLVTALARGENIKQEILDKSHSAGRPSLYESNAFIESNQDAKLYRTRTIGEPDKILASFKVAEMVGARQATIKTADIIEGKRVVMEEFMLGAHESNANDIELVNTDNATTFLAHAMITEDLDWQSRNFVVNTDGELVRVDSKQVFIEEGDNINIGGNPTEQYKQELLKIKIKADPIMKAILARADEQKVAELVHSFDTEKYRAALLDSGIEAANADKIISVTTQNIKESQQRLHEYKALL